MKRTARILALVMLLSVGAASVVHAGVFDPKRYSICYNDKGQFDPQDKSCDPDSCGCIFHEIGEFILDIFG